jgi:hypothetical protein
MMQRSSRGRFVRLFAKSGIFAFGSASQMCLLDYQQAISLKNDPFPEFGALERRISANG